MAHALEIVEGAVEVTVLVTVQLHAHLIAQPDARPLVPKIAVAVVQDVAPHAQQHVHLIARDHVRVQQQVLLTSNSTAMEHGWVLQVHVTTVLVVVQMDVKGVAVHVLVVPKHAVVHVPVAVKMVVHHVRDVRIVLEVKLNLSTELLVPLVRVDAVPIVQGVAQHVKMDVSHVPVVVVVQPLPLAFH